MGCIECDERTERSVYPYWGRAPGGDRVLQTETGIVFAQCDAAPSSTWPASFHEDEEMPGFGTYECPKCFEREESEIMEKRLSIDDLMKAAGAPEGAKVVSLTWSSNPDGTQDLNESGDPCAALYVEWRENERKHEDAEFVKAVQGLMVEHGVSRFTCAFIDAGGEREGVVVRYPGEDFPEDAEDGIGPRVEILPEEGPLEMFTVILMPEETGGYTAYLEELPAVSSQGASADQTLERIREALGAWFDDPTIGATVVLKTKLRKSEG